MENLKMEQISTSNSNYASFDEIIGHIEDILIEPEFQEIQKYFLEKYWEKFDPVDENKLIYMDIFNEYHKSIETYLEDNLKKTVAGFSMEKLTKQLIEMGPELDGEVFEVLFTFTDFIAFKEMFLDYRAIKEGKVVDLSSGISITSVNITDPESESFQ